jgi:hypothetical protein
MMSVKKDYQAYLLRIWREDNYSPWRASTQEVRGGEHRQFASLSELFDFLRSQTEVPDHGGKSADA